MCVLPSSSFLERITHLRLQILDAHSNFLKQVNFTAAPFIFSIAAIGIPLDSLRLDNVTYSAFDTRGSCMCTR